MSRVPDSNEDKGSGFQPPVFNTRTIRQARFRKGASVHHPDQVLGLRPQRKPEGEAIRRLRLAWICREQFMHRFPPKPAAEMGVQLCQACRKDRRTSGSIRACKACDLVSDLGSILPNVLYLFPYALQPWSRVKIGSLRAPMRALSALTQPTTAPTPLRPCGRYSPSRPSPSPELAARGSADRCRRAWQACRRRREMPSSQRRSKAAP